MLPTLHPGEIVRLEASDEVRPGQIVAFEHGGGLLVHRVLTVAPDHIVCRGDNRLVPDGPTPREAIVGRAVVVFGPRRHGGARLRDDAAALWRADVRLCARRMAGVLRHVAAELALLGRQVAGRATAATVTPMPNVPDLSRPFTLSSWLVSGERRAILKTWAEGQPDGVEIAVRALAFTRSHRLARAGALARRALGWAGIDAGRPGDAVLWDVETAALRAVHLFTEPELVAELEATGLGVTHVALDVQRGLAMWRASAVRRQEVGASVACA